MYCILFYFLILGFWCLLIFLPYSYDATSETRLGRYVNDSRQYFNCVMKSVIGKNDEAPYLCLFAICDIGEGVELRYNYNATNLKFRQVYFLFSHVLITPSLFLLKQLLLLRCKTSMRSYVRIYPLKKKNYLNFIKERQTIQNLKLLSLLKPSVMSISF